MSHNILRLDRDKVPGLDFGSRRESDGVALDDLFRVGLRGRCRREAAPRPELKRRKGDATPHFVEREGGGGGGEGRGKRDFVVEERFYGRAPRSKVIIRCLTDRAI